MRVLVFGGRDFADIFSDTKDRRLVLAEHRFVMQSLYEYATSQQWNIHIISGAARGADTVAIAFAKDHGVPYSAYPVTSAEWREFKGFAGPRRNQIMLDQGKPDVGLMFPGGRGTRDMRIRLTKANIPIINYGAEWKALH